MKAMPWLMLPSLALGAACLAPAAMASPDVPATRTLQRSVDVPAGDNVVVENLDGHMRVVQGSGPLQVTATVVAGGDHAAALAQSVKLDVSTAGKQVLVHVHYPVDRYDTFVYNPSTSSPGSSDSVCFLGHLICFHGHSSNSLSYQGKRVRIHENSDGGSGAPLYVDVVVRLPAHVSGSFDNAIGLLEADGLANDLHLSSEGGDIHAQALRGQLDASSSGGDIHMQDLQGVLAADSSGGDIHLTSVASSDARLHSGGGDITGSALNGNFEMRSGGGDTKLENVGGKLSLATGGGDARLSGTLSELRSLDAQTGGGDLTVIGNLAALTSLRAATGGGDATFRTSALSARLDASSGGGDIHVSLPDMRNVNSGSYHFSAEIGAATGTATLHSGGGDITVAQQ